MSSQDQKPSSPWTGSQGAYEKLCCLILNWDDGGIQKEENLQELQNILHDKYGAYVRMETVDHTDLDDGERTFSYAVENFVKDHDSRKNLLLVYYSGCSYVHEGQLFLEPHNDTKPTVQWTDYVDRRMLSSVASILLVLDTTYMRREHYAQFWTQTRERMEVIEQNRREGHRMLFNVLAFDGSDMGNLLLALNSASIANLGGFTAWQLCASMQPKSATQTGPVPILYRKGVTEDPNSSNVVLVPLRRPKLKLYEHQVFIDPHNEYLKEHTTINRDGACHVRKLTLGPDIQQFSPSPVVVAVKRFRIKPGSRPYILDDFMREKENLVEISKWRHNHILGMLASFETRCDGFDTLNIVLDFAGGGNLYDFLRLEGEGRWRQRGYPTADPSLGGCLADWRYSVYREAVGLVDALAELHEEKDGKFMIHCDIKPANVLIHKGVFKLADFGLSKFKDSDQSSKTEWHRGTALYGPPEKEAVMGRGRDVWALGCVLLEIALMIRHGLQPNARFEAGVSNVIDDFEILRKRWSQEYGGEGTAIYSKTLPCVSNVVRGFSNLQTGLRRKITLDGMIPTIDRMLEKDQTRRISAVDAADDLNAHFVSLQQDFHLRREIEVHNNPGGPPVSFDWGDFKQSLLQHDRPNSAGKALGVPLLPLPRRLNTSTSFESSGATSKMDGLGLRDNARSLSMESQGSNKRRRIGSEYDYTAEDVLNWLP